MTLIKRHNGYGFPTNFEDFFKTDFFGGTEMLKPQIPTVNIKENDTDFTVELAAPGLKKEDFNIEVDKNIITISSEQKHDNQANDNSIKYTKREFSYQSFKRAFTLPDTVADDQIKANYENGILTIALPKKEEALPKAKRLIEIG